MVDSTSRKKALIPPLIAKIAKSFENLRMTSFVQYGSALTESSLRREKIDAPMVKTGTAAWPMK